MGRHFRSFLTISLTLAWLSPVFDANAEIQPVKGDPVRVFVARSIHTMNPSMPLAEAVAVGDGGRIVAVGSRDEVMGALGTADVVLDESFGNKVIVPGLIEQHIHPILSALTLTSHIISIEDWVLPGQSAPAVRDRAAYISRLKGVEAGIPDPDELLLTWGYHHYFHGALTRQDLDKISLERPIIVWHRSAHEFVLNTKALQAAGVTEEVLAKAGELARSQIDLNRGHFWEAGAFDFLLPRIFLLIAGKLRPGLELTEQYLHSAGVTASAEPGGMSNFYELQTAVLGDADTPFRFFFIPDGRGLAQQHTGEALLRATEDTMTGTAGNTAFLPRQVKLFSDGAIYSQLMQMRDGYLDGHHGEWLMEKEVFAAAFKTYWDAGYQIHIHQNGDKGLDRVLEVLAANMRRNPRKDHRTTIVHFGFSTREQVQKLAELGAIVSANPYYTVALADKYGAVGIGPKRADSMVRLSEVVKQRIPLALHSDMPMAPAQPLFLMWAAVNRTTFSGRAAAPELAISVEEALKAVTINAAYSLRLEHEIGSIEQGKRADFTVLEQSPFEVPKQAIKDIKIWGTVLGGRQFPNTEGAAIQSR